MRVTAEIVDVCTQSGEQGEDFGVGYNAIIGVVAYNTEHRRASGSKGSIEAVACQPRDKFESLFWPLRDGGQYSKRFYSFVYGLDSLVSWLLPHMGSLPDSILQEMQVQFLCDQNSSLLEE